jgi:environmental stress-induced protein Ves
VSDRKGLRFREIPVSDQVEMPWKNGGGVTREIFRADDAAGLLWRASLADVTKSGPFSLFPGCNRIIAVVEGGPMLLDFEDGEQIRVDLGSPREFSCDRALTGRPEGKPCRDFNLIWRRKDVAVSGSVLSVEGKVAVQTTPANWHLQSVMEGQAVVEAASFSARLERGDALLISDDQAISTFDLIMKSSRARLLAFSVRL